MKWGCCGDLERVAAIDAAGYDFIESPVRALCTDEPPETAQPYLQAVAESRLKAEAFNVFVPGTLPIVGPDVDAEALRRHVSAIADRIAPLDVSIVVLGSGGARKIPDGWSAGSAREQVVAFCHLASDILGPAGVTIVIEPLAASACNYIHTVTEALSIADEVARPEVAVLADLYHMDANGDPIADLGKVSTRLEHVHLPVPNIPGLIEHDTDFDHAAYLGELKQQGYAGRISVEDNGKRFGDFEREAGPVLAHLKQLWNSV